MSYLILDDQVEVQKSETGRGFLFRRGPKAIHLDHCDAEVLSLVEKLVSGQPVTTDAPEMPRDAAATDVLERLMSEGLVATALKTEQPGAKGPNAGETTAINLRTNASVSGLSDGLALNGFRCVKRGHEDVKLVVSLPYDRDFIRAENRASMNAATPTFFASITRGVLEFGPYVIPWQSACFECVEHRLEAAQDNTDFGRTTWTEVRSSKQTPNLEGVLRELSISMLVSLAAAADETHLINGQTLYHPRTASFTNHPVLKVPGCPACGRKADGAGI